MSGVVLDSDLVAEIAARLDLREPNREALESIAIEYSQHFDVSQLPAPLEVVVSVATGVGKTYIVAAAIDYLVAARGTRNLAIIAPGRTILRKTVDNFTAGAPKSLISGMATIPVVITADTFNTPVMRAVMDDQEQVKLYVFTVQALTKPETTTGRRTHKFQEGLGQAFYAHLQSCADLVVFADEHHAYYGAAFSKTVRELRPQALIGLTATPHRQTPPDQIVYRYPLAAAIADRLVKTPVIVGRKDDRAEIGTKLLDGLRLLDLKRETLTRYAAAMAVPTVNPVMLVIANDIEGANEIKAILEAPTFAGGVLQGCVLTVHSNSPDAALEALEKVEDQSSPIRVIVAVGMLKEGWDVKNVYVIASLRSSVSELLTEQTMGRGLRLPFGKYTEIEFLDTLEILAHERYEDLLRKANVLNQSFIDVRTRAVLRRNALGNLTATRESSEVEAPIVVDAFTTSGDEAAAPPEEHRAPVFGSPLVTSLPRRVREADETLKMARELAPRPGAPPLRIPLLVMTTVNSRFSLSDITNLQAFRQLGSQLAADPVAYLRRVTTSAQIVTGRDGLRYTKVVTAPAVDLVQSKATLLLLPDATDQLRERLLSASVVPARGSERRAAEPLIREFLIGLGEKAQEVLSAFLDRAASALIGLVTDEQRRVGSRPQFDEVIEIISFAPLRAATRPMDLDRFGAFSKAVCYSGWRRNLYDEAWFDSEPERAVANILDEADEVLAWVRLSIGDLPILWSGAGQNYNPDFIVIEHDNVHWIVEVKADKEMADPDVGAKREAARRWANHVSASEHVNVQWRYLLVSQSQVEAVRGSWPGLKLLER